MKLVVLLSTLLAGLNVFAVTVKDCPKKLTVGYADVYVQKTLQYVYDHANLSAQNGDEKEIASVTKAFNNLGTKKTVVSLPLTRAKNGRCEYYNKGQSNREQIVLYSSKGKDIIMVDAPTLGERGELVRVYGTIIDMSANGLEVSKKAGLALAVPRTPYKDYSAGGDLVFIGQVRDLTVLAE